MAGIAMRRLDDAEALDAPGDFALAVRDEQAGYRAIGAGEEPTHILLVTPSGEVHLPIGRAKPVPGPSWTWDGDRDRPTLTPSIWVNKPTGWHGFVRAGVLVDA